MLKEFREAYPEVDITTSAPFDYIELKQQALERTRRSKEAAKSEHALGRSMMLQFAINEPLTGPAAGTSGT